MKMVLPHAVGVSSDHTHARPALEVLERSIIARSKGGSQTRRLEEHEGARRLGVMGKCRSGMTEGSSPDGSPCTGEGNNGLPNPWSMAKILYVQNALVAMAEKAIYHGRWGGVW